MQKKMSDLRRLVYLVLAVELGVVALFWVAVGRNALIALIVLAAEAVLLFYLLERFENLTVEHSAGVEEMLGTSSRDAYLFGETGMLFYDDEHVVTWMSDLFNERGINRVGRKLLVWLPEAEDLINGSADQARVVLDDRIYEISRKEDEPVLFFRDITDTEEYRHLYQESKAVIGLASLDNYEESTQYEDEAVVSAINVAVRTPLTEYCKEHGILVKRVNNYRYLLVLNEKIFSDLMADHFSVLNTVRKAAQKQDVSITLSMAFARGTDSYEELDEMVARLLDLAQSRGGDQVAVQNAGEDVKYFGGSSEATEKRSRVRVRVMAHTLREMILRSSNVIICGHRNADFDCIGSAIGAARICEALRKQCCIIAKTGGIEEKLNACMEENMEELKEEVSFVTENEALNQLQDNTLVLMVDHHSLRQSNGSKVLEQAKKIAVIDHHRRATEMGVKPMFLYIEAGASSACELITELIPYISNRVELSALDATIMLAGMTIDTQHFRVRTGTRTFDAASSLRRSGADPLKVDEYLKDSYDQFEQKTNAMAMSQIYENGIVITPVKGMTMSRAMMSQTADALLQIQDVEAVFVIADDTENETAISARSNGRVNVQVIMENMHGGGHMTAAAMQRPKCSIDDLRKELIDVLENYFREEDTNESDS